MLYDDAVLLTYGVGDRWHIPMFPGMKISRFMVDEMMAFKDHIHHSSKVIDMELYFSIFEVESMKILSHFDFCVLYRTISSAAKSSRHPKSQITSQIIHLLPNAPSAIPTP